MIALTLLSQIWKVCNHDEMLELLLMNECVQSKIPDGKPTPGNGGPCIKQGAYTGPPLLWRGIKAARLPRLAVFLLSFFLP
jgi:hypothetical protein